MRGAAALATIFALALGATARAGDTVDPVFEARMHYERGEEAYVGGRYFEALQAFEEAYRITGRPALLFNISICFERLGQLPAAAAALRRYLASDPSVRDREQLLGKAAELETRAALGSGAAANSAAPRPPRVRGFRRAVLAGAGVTAALAAVAIATTVAAGAGYRALSESCPMGGADCSAGARDRQLALDHAADALWALAGAGAIVTVTLHLLLRRERARAASLAPVVAISPSLVAGALRVDF